MIQRRRGDSRPRRRRTPRRPPSPPGARPPAARAAPARRRGRPRSPASGRAWSRPPGLGAEPGQRDLVGDVGQLERQRQVVGGRRARRGSYADRLRCPMTRRTSSRARRTEVLQQLIRFNTVNPPGNERPAIEYLERLRAPGRLRDRDARRRRRAPEPGRRPRRRRRRARRCASSATSTRCWPTPSEWRHDPWSGDVADGFLWGRGALDMKSQVAAEAVAGAALARERLAPGPRHAEARVRLRRGDRRRRRRQLADQHPPGQGPLRHAAQRGRAARSFEYGGRRRYGVCCAEKGIFRFNVTAHRRGRPRLAAADRRQRAAEAGAGAGRARRPAGVASRSPRRRRRCSTDSARTPRTRRGAGADRRGRPAPARPWSSRCSASR